MRNQEIEKEITSLTETISLATEPLVLIQSKLKRALCYSEIEESSLSLADGLFVLKHQDFNRINPEAKTCTLTIISNAYFKLKEFGEALEYAEKAIKGNNKDSFAIYLRGITKCALGKIKDAIEDLRLSISINENFAPAYKNLAICYTTQRKFKLAVQNIDKAIELSPEVANYYHTKALMMIDFNKKAEASKAAIKAVELDPTIAKKEDPRYLVDLMPG